MEFCDPVDTLIVEKSKLDEDTQRKAIDPTHYRSMARPIEKHLHAVKRIFRYLRGTVNQGLWYSKDSAIALTTFTDADHVGCQDTRRSTSGNKYFIEYTGIEVKHFRDTPLQLVKDKQRKGQNQNKTKQKRLKVPTSLLRGVNPLIDHHCCYECGNSLNEFFCYQCTCEFCGNGAHLPVCYDDDDDEEKSNSLHDNIIFGLPSCSAITLNEPVDSLSMGDEHLSTIPTTESDEFIKSSVENLVPNPSEFEGENGCDVPACFTTFLNVLCDAEYEFDSVDDQSLFDEDFREEIFSNPLFEEEIIHMKINQHHFNAESDLIESMLNHDSSIIPSSSKIDSLLDEFASELTLLKSIPPGIDEIDCHPENEIRFSERLFDSYMEDIDLSFNPDNPMLSSIEEDDDDSKKDILIHEELLDNYSLSLPVNESFYFDIPLFSCPPAKPPDGNTGILNIKMMGDISDQSIPENVKTLAKGFYPPSLHFLSFSWES
nr:hypothetical protein [Tanacetum cinerariifolium]